MSGSASEPAHTARRSTSSAPAGSRPSSPRSDRTTWEYLTLRVSWDSNARSADWVLDRRNRGSYADALDGYDKDRNPVSFLQEVLGPDGWEMISSEDRLHEHYGNAAFQTHTAPIATLYWFKRPVW